jgi:hypothetical protein
MRPILFQWRGLTVWSYPALLYVGLVLGVLAGNVAAHAAGVDALGVFEATFLLLLPALVGARLLFVATHWSDFRSDGAASSRGRTAARRIYGALAMILPLSVPVTSFWASSGRRTRAFTILVGAVFTRSRLFPERLLRRKLPVRHWGSGSRIAPACGSVAHRRSCSKRSWRRCYWPERHSLGATDRSPAPSSSARQARTRLDASDSSR